MTLYAVMICLDGVDDWIYVTKQTEHCWDLQPVLFADIYKALEYAKTFEIEGKEHNVKVVSYG